MFEPLDVDRVFFYRISRTKDYFREIYPKKQLFIHHSVSHPDPYKLINSWKARSVRAATSLVIAGKPSQDNANYADGDIFSAFPSRYWALHLGIHSRGNQVPVKYKVRQHTRDLEKASISIQICNAGPLTWENGRFYTPFRTVVPEEEVIEYMEKFRGHQFYHKYSEAQIKSLQQLLVYLCEAYEIPKKYKADMWDLNQNALDGAPGVYVHGSVRTDITDCHPQPELVEMLMGLESIVQAPEDLTATGVPGNE